MEEVDYFNNQDMFKKIGSKDMYAFRFDYSQYLETKALLKLNKISIDTEVVMNGKNYIGHNYSFFQDKMLDLVISEMKDCMFTLFAKRYLKKSLMFNEELSISLFCSFIEGEEIDKKKLIEHTNNFINDYEEYFLDKYDESFNRFIRK
jgi:hypothetical protein